MPGYRIEGLIIKAFMICYRHFLSLANKQYKIWILSSEIPLLGSRLRVSYPNLCARSFYPGMQKDLVWVIPFILLMIFLLILDSSGGTSRSHCCISGCQIYPIKFSLLCKERSGMNTRHIPYFLQLLPRRWCGHGGFGEAMNPLRSLLAFEAGYTFHT